MKYFNRILSLVSCATLLIAIAPKANAATMTGTIGMTGDDSFNTTSVSMGPAEILGGSGANTGSFAGLADFTPVSILANFSYTTGTNSLGSSTTIFSVGGFSFAADSYTASYTTDTTGCSSATCLDITWFGDFTGNGYDPTPGSFTLSSQETNGQTSTTFSGSALATPEPGSIVLLGSGLLAMAGTIRRRVMA